MRSATWAQLLWRPCEKACGASTSSAIDDRILDAAGTLEPQVLRTLDAIHLATAMAVGDDLEVIVTYDERMVDAARLLGLSSATPR